MTLEDIILIGMGQTQYRNQGSLEQQNQQNKKILKGDLSDWLCNMVWVVKQGLFYATETEILVVAQYMRLDVSADPGPGDF